MLLETYRRSLKMPAAEEFFDLIFYRPAAYLCVLGFAKTPVTPNQITILSLIAGCIAAYELSFGTYGAYIAAGICYATANILDCADGQLARIKKNGTPLGRLVDGIADYISSIAIFLGIGFGLGTAGTSQWWLVVAAGVSSALHAIKFDDVQGRFIAIVKDEKGFTSSEIEKYKTNIAQLQRSDTAGLKYWIMKLYLAYLNIQQRFRSPDNSAIDRKKFYTENILIIRWWTLLGPTTNRTLLILSALLGNVEMFLWLILIPGNLWLVVCLIYQKMIDKKIATRMA